MSTAAIKEMTDEELSNFIYENDHNEEYDEGDLVHIEWDCAKCDAQTEKSSRFNLKQSKLPGHLPYKARTNTLSTNLFVSEVQIGDYARYLSKPGTSDYAYEYAECISIKLDESIGEYTLEWRKTNTDEKSFFATYDELDNLNIIRKI